MERQWLVDLCFWLAATDKKEDLGENKWKEKSIVVVPLLVLAFLIVDVLVYGFVLVIDDEDIMMMMIMMTMMMMMMMRRTRSLVMFHVVE